LFCCLFFSVEVNMNRIFNAIFSGSTAPLDPQSRTLFINEATELLDRLVRDLGEYSKSIQAMMGSEYSVTHDFHRFGFKFDPEDEKTSIGEFVSTLSSVGHMGNTVCTMLEERKKEIDGQLRRATELRARINAFLKFSRGKNPSDPAVLNAFDSLKLDFTSEILDQSIRLYDGHFRFCHDVEGLLSPVMQNTVPHWRTRCCSIQDNSLEIRKAAVPMSGDGLLTRGCSTAIFGVPLQQLPLVPGYGIPQILFDTSNAILRTPGILDQEGLFRLSASKTDLMKIKGAYDQGQNVCIWEYEPNAIAGTMKLWLRELPDSVIPAKIGVKFAAAAKDDPLKIKSFLRELPEVNRRCLHKMMEVGYHVAKHSASNKMTSDNVSVVFGPIIIRREDELNPLTQIANLNALANNMLKNYEIIFGPFMC